MSSALDTRTEARVAVQGKVLIVDDDPWMLHTLGDRLSGAQYQVRTAQSATEALATARTGDFDVILLDHSLPDLPGMEVLRRIKAEEINGGVVIVSGQDDVTSVVDAMRLGALDYLVKPVDPERVLATVALAARAGRLERENRRLVRKLNELQGNGMLIGCSPVIRRLTGVLSRAAEGDATLLIEGKPGTGKTLAAHLVHQSSRRCHRALLSIAGEAATAEVLEAKLHEAEKGTLLIEDVETMPAAGQGRLVRCLKERNPGAGMPATGPDVRLMATTAARLPELVARGKFREDLYYRLNVFPLVVPSLGERKEDIALLAMHFLECCAEQSKVPHKGFTAAAMILLEAHPWPGNVAQLQNAIFRAHAIAGAAAIDRVHLLGPSTGLGQEAPPPRLAAPVDPDEEEPVREEDVVPLEIEEKRCLARALKATKGNVRRAAQLLRIGRATLYRKIQVYKLKLN